MDTIDRASALTNFSTVDLLDEAARRLRDAGDDGNEAARNGCSLAEQAASWARSLREVGP